MAGIANAPASASAINVRCFMEDPPNFVGANYQELGYSRQLTLGAHKRALLISITTLGPNCLKSVCVQDPYFQRVARRAKTRVPLSWAKRVNLFTTSL